MTKRRRRFVLALAALAAAAAALALAAAAGAIPPGLSSLLTAPRFVRAEVVVVDDGAVHDYRIDRGRVVAAHSEAVVLAERDGTMQTVPLDPAVAVTLNGRPVPLGRVRPGMQATTIRDGDAGATFLLATRGRR